MVWWELRRCGRTAVREVRGDERFRAARTNE
jgi:hypothetical protein